MKKIIHIDMDCFFAAVEMRDHPPYKDVPLAVGGKQRGVLTTCNYKAREYGIRSAMPTAKAMQLCPDLVVVPTRMPVYKEVSKKIRSIFQRYTSIIEPLSLDEAYLDVSDSSFYQGSATKIALAIRQDIKNECNLTASAGVAPLKFLAKIASDINKPDGQYVITPNNVSEFIKTLPLEKIPGVGKVTIKKLHQSRLFTCHDIQQYNYHTLVKQFGRFGVSLWHRSHAIDEREVIIKRVRKSIGVERTLSDNLISEKECWKFIQDQLYPELQKRLKQSSDNRDIIKQGIKIKFADFQVTTIEQIQPTVTLNVYQTLLTKVLERQNKRAIRLLGLYVTLKPPQNDKQLSLLPL